MTNQVDVIKADTPPTKKRAGFTEQNEPHPGVDPDTGERLAVTFEGMKAEFGEELGAKKYLRIAGIREGSVFFNPKMESTLYHPTLGLDELNPEIRKEIDAILQEKE